MYLDFLINLPRHLFHSTYVTFYAEHEYFELIAYCYHTVWGETKNHHCDLQWYLYLTVISFNLHNSTCVFIEIFKQSYHIFTFKKRDGTSILKYFISTNICKSGTKISFRQFGPKLVNTYDSHCNKLYNSFLFFVYGIMM